MVRRLVILSSVVLAMTACDVPVLQCEKQTDCFGGEQCVDGTCVPVTQSLDGGDLSDTADASSSDVSGNCRLGGDDPCGALVCNVTTGQCEPCQRDQQCEGSELCDTIAGECVCKADHHACDGVCVPNASADSCGSRCEPCPEVPNAIPTCESGDCSFRCADGFEACGDCGFDRECIECRVDTDCSEYGAARCVDGLCAPCEIDTHCDGLDRSVCADGTCVECDVGKEGPCDGNSCDPATNECTQTGLRSREFCETCVADSECEPNHRCVQMEYQTSVRPDGYCLVQANQGCLQVDPIQVQRDSLSGVIGEFYCTIREDLVTCEAVKDFGDPCDQDSDCGVENISDGKCRLFDNKRQCTYACVNDNECAGGTMCIGNPPDNSYCARF